MSDPLALMKKGARAEKQERLRELCLKIDRCIQAIQFNTFRIHDEDLDSIKEDQVLASAGVLAETVKLARKIKHELED